VLFIVNDRPDVAREVGAHGAHVGQGDDLVRARDRLGPAGVLGVSVTDATQVGGAVACGADYLAVTVWPTETKPEAVPGGLGTLEEVVRAASVPVVGIGGIDPGNAPKVLAAGAAGVAVISAVADAEDPVAATRELVRVVEQHAGRSA
jgi:thiamine-phosphate pyrophosphorylase